MAPMKNFAVAVALCLSACDNGGMATDPENADGSESHSSGSNEGNDSNDSSGAESDDDSGQPLASVEVCGEKIAKEECETVPQEPVLEGRCLWTTIVEAAVEDGTCASLTTKSGCIFYGGVTGAIYSDRECPDGSHKSAYFRTAASGRVQIIHAPELAGQPPRPLGGEPGRNDGGDAKWEACGVGTMSTGNPCDCVCAADFPT